MLSRRASIVSGVARRTATLLVLVTFLGCGDAASVGNARGEPSDQARFSLDCDFGGVRGALTLDVEAVGNTGVTWGTGPRPDITGVIPAGTNTLFTTGSFVLPDRTYAISGENSFADLWSNIPGDRLLVEWIPMDQGLTMVWDWQGPAIPVPCQLTDARYL